MIEKILADYIKFIRDFENLMKEKYFLVKNERILSGIEILFPRKGKINDYKYQFHGAGCRLEKNEIICEYNYYLEKITFTLWDLRQFINTHPLYKSENLDNKYLEIKLYRLIERNKLSWKITDDGVVWEVYQYNN